MAASVTPTIGPPNEAWTTMFDYDGSGNLIYTGLALSTQPRSFQYTVSSYNPGAPGTVTTSAAHGLQSGQKITIAGAIGDWAATNGDQIVTVTGTTTFTIPPDSSGYSGSFAGTMSTFAPRTNAVIWALSKNYYTVANLTRSAWADGSTGVNHAWDSRTTYAYL